MSQFSFVVVVVVIGLLVVVPHIRPQQLPMVDWARTGAQTKASFLLGEETP